MTKQENIIASRIEKARWIHCVGIAGSGVNPIARYLARKTAIRITGSDRFYDQGKNSRSKNVLEDLGVEIFPQDGLHLTSETSLLISSAAVESQIPDIIAANKYNVPVLSRAEVLSTLVNTSSGIAISGTSGKTTVTGMCGLVFAAANLDPSVINGGNIIGLDNGLNDTIRTGSSDILIVEADESDGSLIKYFPEFGVLLNVTKDHKPLDELEEIFRTFSQQCKRGRIYNRDDRRIQKIIGEGGGRQADFSFGWSSEADIFPQNVQCESWTSTFSVKGTPFFLHVPGKHNVSNALAAIALGLAYDIPVKTIAEGLAAFRGIERRLNLIGTVNDIMVIDDFAHNPDKIKASLTTLKALEKRLIIIFQPHGYGPTKFLRKELIESFVQHSRKDDVFVLPEIFYAGGTVNKEISSEDLVADLKEAGRQAYFVPHRKEILSFVPEMVQPGDCVAVLGARDDTLTEFAQALLTSFAGKSEKR